MWKPRPGWLLVAPVLTDEKLPNSLLIIPEQIRAKMTQWQYEVVASGGPSEVDPEVWQDTPSNLSEGDWILAPQRVAFEVIEEDVILLAERQVWAVIGA